MPRSQEEFDELLDVLPNEDSKLIAIKALDLDISLCSAIELLENTRNIWISGPLPEYEI
ncbi:hypothetical protein Metho_2464 (plasmid) [Methanomethylovorans hollandica DSM 15978]|jgi:hypothetical protein|uniref:Uncharacterized protein n=1 Tax=Methanomethylovorans hollandica (strain DSM 15978 / NBRC 107637 / DMS1) TaxID=867904 RepID=L0L2S0_METHD|nr:hypothetical protein [Methanomethylovorans hollandica]AGB50604.1 hypothetical protein Metho_2464 [Methanomethylovorans hollandica DSM 15978]